MTFLTVYEKKMCGTILYKVLCDSETTGTKNLHHL